MFKRRSTKLVNKFLNKFEKQGKKLLSKLSYDKYLNNFGNFNSGYVVDNHFLNNDLMITSTYLENKSTRRIIVETLITTNFERTSWSEQVVVAFIDETISLFSGMYDGEYFDNYKSEICQRYNVAPNKLKTIVSTFLRNAENGNDKYNIHKYFSDIDLVLYKYPTHEKIQEAVENDKLQDYERFLLEEYGMIEK